MKNNLKLLTLNAHSHAEPDYEKKLHLFAEGIAALQPDVIALQEVSQTITSPAVNNLHGYSAAFAQTNIGTDNHIYRVTQLLEQNGHRYYWTWLPIKRAYGNLTEGIGLMSLAPITEIRYGCISRTDDMSSWRRRMILGVQTAESPNTWFYSTHMARWDDPVDPFLYQWKATETILPKQDTVWLMGDFNNPAQARNQGYDCICESGWHDTFTMAQWHDIGITVDHVIDGWRDNSEAAGMRMDQIWCSRTAAVLRSEVVFNGHTLPVVSDHFGVMATILLT